MTRFPGTATNVGCPICPDFLRRPVALIHFMRLSLIKGAHADLSGNSVAGNRGQALFWP